MNKFLAYISVIAMMILVWNITPSIAEEELSLPDAENLTAGAGISLNAGIDNAKWIGSMEVTGDGVKDVLIIDAGSELHVLRNNSSVSRVAFEEVGTPFGLDGKVVSAHGDDIDNDGDMDIFLGLQGETMPVFSEQLSTITTITDTVLTDDSLNLRHDELAGLTIKPKISSDEEFTVTSNGTPAMTAEEHPYGLGPHQILVEDGGLIATGARPGDYYIYKKAQAKMTSPNRGVIYLNDGNGAFTVPPCSSELAIPAGRLIDDVFTGDFNGDGIVDAVVQHSKYYEGTVTDVQFTVTGLDISGGGFDMYEGFMGYDQPYFDDDLSISITITDNRADFDTNAFLDKEINPNIKQNNFYVVRANTATTIMFVIDISSMIGGSTTGQLLDAMVRSGDTYRVKTGDAEYEVFKGLGEGCYQSMDSITGENFELDYKEIDIDGDSRLRSMLYSPYVNFGKKDTLVGRSVNPASNTNNTELYTIESNTATTLIFTPGQNITVFNDKVHNFEPDTFTILADTTFFVDEGNKNENQLLYGRIPGEYTTLGLDAGDAGPPYRGTVLDINNDGSDDIMFIANSILYKLQQ